MGRVGSRAGRVHTRARDLYQAAGDRHGAAQAWNNLGSGLRRLGRLEAAVEAYGKALETCREFEDWYGEAVTLGNLARAHEAAHRTAEARTAYLQAADAYTRANAPDRAARTRAAEYRNSHALGTGPKATPPRHGRPHPRDQVRQGRPPAAARHRSQITADTLT